MTGWVDVAGPEHSLYLFGVKMLGLNAANGRKLLLTLAFALAVWLLVRLLRIIARLFLRGRTDARAGFWSRQAVQLFGTAVFLIAFFSIWFDSPGRVAGSLGLVTAGLAVALQRVITAVAAYFVILRGHVFNVGDRIAMAGVRGDVIALGYTRTTIMEMGQPPKEQEAAPAMWVEARQYTGRIVTVTNDKIFDEPVYNYSRGFPYIWEEINLPVPYSADPQQVEQFLLDTARRHAVDTSTFNAHDVARLHRMYGVTVDDAQPRVYTRLTDNWLEMTLRFLVPDHGIRGIKDAMSRDILRAMRGAGIPVASTTVAIVEAPPIRIERGE
jgi:small-conductance mechanosensitive channel